ncbi:MAG: TetR family transcriptional regulator [Pikeienuella sp.]
MNTRDAKKSNEKRQSRSIRTEQQLLDTAQDLFARQGYQATKITEIVEGAGVSIGSFYHHFKDKEALAGVLVSRFIEHAGRIIDSVDLSRDTHGNVEGMLTYLARAICDTMTGSLGVYRAAQRINSLSTDKQSSPGILVAPLKAKVMAQLPDYDDEIAGPDKAEALRHALQLVIMVMLQTRLGAGELFPKDTDKLIAVTVKAAMGLLR